MSTVTTEESAREAFRSALEKFKKEHKGQAYRNALGQTSDLAERSFLARVVGAPVEVFKEEGSAYAELLISLEVMAWWKR